MGTTVSRLLCFRRESIGIGNKLQKIGEMEAYTDTGVFMDVYDPSCSLQNGWIQNSHHVAQVSIYVVELAINCYMVYI